MRDLMADAWITVGPGCPISYEIDTGRVHVTFGGGRAGGVDLLMAPAAVARLVELAQQALAQTEVPGGDAA